MRHKMPMLFGALCIVAILVVPLVGQQSLALAQSGSITTLFATDNSADGNMFDVTALENLRITSFDVNIAGTGCTLNVHYKSGSYVGFETNPGAWTLLGSVTVTSNGSNVATPVNIGGLTIPAGATYGLYLEVIDPCDMLYTNGSNTYSNADIRLDLGAGLDNSFGSGGGVIPGRIWNGTIYYDLLGELPSDAYQKIGQVQVNAPGTALYEEPGGNPVRNAAGNEIWIPNQTAPDPSQDVYDVISQVEFDGQTWVNIFVGNSNRPVWVPVGGPVQVLSLAQ